MLHHSPIKVGLFGKLSDVPFDGMFRGASAADTRLCPVLQNPGVWKRNQMDRTFDLAVIYGLGNARSIIRDDYEAIGVPVIVMEQGHIQRGDYWQVGIHSINWLPDEACPSDRRLSMGINRPKRRETPEDGYVLVLGQKPGDAQHTITNMEAWAASQLRALRAATTRKIIWRPHPLSISDVPGFNETHHPDMPLEDSFDGAHAVVTHNSNAGLKALLAGVPVCCDPGAMYAESCTTDLALIDKPGPARGLLKLINRICYAQWTQEEMAEGLAWDFILPRIFSEAAVDDALDAGCVADSFPADTPDDSVDRGPGQDTYDGLPDIDPENVFAGMITAADG